MSNIEPYVLVMREAFPDATEREIEKFKLVMEYGMLQPSYIMQLLFSVVSAITTPNEDEPLTTLGESVDAIVEIILEFADCAEFEEFAKAGVLPKNSWDN